MTWPTGAVVTTNTDSDADSPLSARPNLLDLIQKFNQVQAHASSIGQTLLAAADAAAGRSAIAAAPLVSPTFTGTPAAPTASPGTNTTQLATTAFATAADVIVQAAAIAAAASDATTKANAALASALASMIGVGVTWHNVTGVINTNYTNSTGRPIQTSVTLAVNNTHSSISIKVDGLVVASINNQSSGISSSIPLSAIVPSGSVYRIDTAGVVPSIVSWVELA